MSRLRALHRRAVISIIAAIAVLGAGGVAWALTRPAKTTDRTEIATAAIATLQSTVSASGTIDAAHTASLDFGATGRVTAVDVSVGSKVRKHQVLATIDPSAAQADLDAAIAAADAADAALAADDADNASAAQLAADRAAVVSADSTLSSARTTVKDTKLRATIAGTVTSLDLTKGQEVSSGGSGVQGAEESGSSDSSQVVINSTRTFVVDATVDDTEISELKKGQSVAVTPAGATSTVPGTVSSVSTVPSSTSGVVEFPIVVSVTGHPSGVYAGASATLTITTKKLAHVLEIPTLALSYKGSSATVQLITGEGTVTREVEVGQAYGLETQIVSGLVAGDKVKITIPTFSNLRSRFTGGTSRTGEGGFGNGGFGGEGLTGGPGGGGFAPGGGSGTTIVGGP